MSGRIRTIKPELLEDAVTARLSDSAFRVFIGMFLLADDYGNLRAEKGYLEGQIYWASIPEKSVAECLHELSGDSREGLVRLYRVRGQSYAHICGWSKHQKVQHPGKPRVPGLDQDDSRESRETLTRIPESLAPDLRPPTSDHDPEQKGAREDLAPTPDTAAPIREEPQSETRIRRSEPPVAILPREDEPEPGHSLEHVAIALQIRKHTIFRSLDAHRLASNQVGHMIATGQKLAWVLTSIDDCAAMVDGLGMTAEALQEKLVKFMRHSKRPKDEPSNNRPANRDFTFAPGELEPPRMVPRRPKPEEAPPVSTADNEARAKAAIAMLSGKTGT